MSKRKPNPIVNKANQQAAARREESESGLDIFVASNGMKLRFVDLPSGTAVDVSKSIAKGKPKPPVVFIERLGRSEENPDDADYKDDLKEWEQMQALRIIDTFLLLGTEIVFVPKGIKTMDDPDYLENRELLGVPLSGKGAKKLAWLKDVGLSDKDDLKKVMQILGRKYGVVEEDVADASDSFRPDDGRDASK